MTAAREMMWNRIVKLTPWEIVGMTGLVSFPRVILLQCVSDFLSSTCA